MTPALAAGIAGLAALDSLNPATIVAVSLILVASRRRPVLEALTFVIGAFATVLALGVAIYFGADAASGVVDGGLVWLRRIAFGLAAALVMISALRWLRPRRRKAVGLPTWFGPRTALALGVLMTGADLPNAFPYFVAIERLVYAEVSIATALVALCGYAALYCTPCLVLLGMGMRSRSGSTRRRIAALHQRFGTEADLPARPGVSILLGLVACALAAVALTA